MEEQKDIYAGFILRFAAHIADLIVLSTGSFVVGLILGVIGFAEGVGSGDTAFFRIIGVAIVWIYYAVMESSSKQATLGKMLMGIKVTDLNQRRITFGRASARFFSKIISSLILGIGFLMIAFTEKKQGLHDKISGCLVIRK